MHVPVQNVYNNLIGIALRLAYVQATQRMLASACRCDRDKLFLLKGMLKNVQQKDHDLKNFYYFAYGE